MYQRRGLPVKVVATFPAWRKIEDPDGAQGWMQANMLTDERSGMVKGEVRPMRARPDAGAPIVWRAAPGVVAAMNHYTVKRGTTVTLTGRVNAAYAGERVYRQYWTGRSWRTVTSTVASDSGSYTFTIRPTVRSRTSYRVVLAGTSTHMTGISRTLRLTAR